jgi:Zn-finger nucleic acid-binding protein
MICPNDNFEMQQVKILSHYGQPIFLEQCKGCGGIWFDQAELYSARPGEAEKVELMGSEILRTPSIIENHKHVCPKDQAELFRFTDPYFPKDIVVERCPKCDGFWLNRGEFTKYQKARQELLRPREKTPEDIKLEEDIKQILESHRLEQTDSTLVKLARFLTTPIDENAIVPLDSTQSPPEENKGLALLLNVLTLLLRLFIFR